MLPNSFYWIDYETFGANPGVDRPCQFAGLRTDSNLNVIDDSLVVYCKQSNDYLPHPQACLVTGITPLVANQRGIREIDFIRRIQTEMQVPGTCIVGYNNIRFDDEITRHSLYRNLLDPYEHEWRNNNSRWDLIDVMRLMCALRPEGIEWPEDEQGNPVFRLDQLTQENGIEHGQAHDALADVEATIALAKRVRESQPKLFDYCLQHRTKSAIFPLLNVTDMVPVVHVSSRYPASRHCIALVAPIVAHPVNKNGVIVYDLAVSPQPLIDLDAHEIIDRVFTPRSELPVFVDRIPLKTIHANKCPIVVPASVLRDQDLQRLHIDQALCEEHLALLKQHQLLIQQKLLDVFADQSFPPNNDPDFMLYSGGFISDFDKKLLHKIHDMPVNQLVGYTPDFKDQRLVEMLFRYRARNYPESLTKKERQRWNVFRQERLQNPDQKTGLSLSAFQSVLSEIKSDSLDPEQLGLLDDLEYYTNSIAVNESIEE